MTPYFNQEGGPATEEPQHPCQTYPSVLNRAIIAGLPPQQSEFVPTDSGLYCERSDTSVTEPDSVLGESGWWYHRYKEGKYPLPNDPVSTVPGPGEGDLLEDVRVLTLKQEEQDRLDFQHAALRLALYGRLTLAPLRKTPEHVLDVATGRAPDRAARV